MKCMILAVIPAYNEERSVGNVVKRAKKYVDEVVVVDDGSRDKTAIIAKKAGAIVIRHRVNKGFGAALRTGMKYALKKKAEIIILLDADGQHKPEDIPKFVKKIREGYDFVLGERDLRKYPLIKKIGNLFLTVSADFISGTYLRDTESGYRAFSYKGLKKIYPYLKGKKYEIAAEMIFAVGLFGLRYTNVKVDSPIYIYGKGVGVLDGIRNFTYLLKKRKRNLKAYIQDFKFVFGRWVRRIMNKIFG